MRVPNKAELRSRKFIIIYIVVLLLAGIGYFFWQKYKYPFADSKIRSAIEGQTDKLYSITYDSLYFDEVLGNAYLKNIRIVPDTARLRTMDFMDIPSVALDIRIHSIQVSGVKTVGALSGQNIMGDSLVIDQPRVIMYSLKPFDKQTKIESEATDLYQDILGKLNFIKASYVFINELDVINKDFYSLQKNYALYNAKIKIDDILIDSSHNKSPDRILFSKQAAIIADSFATYNHERRELVVRDINFSGNHQSLLFKEIDVNRFDNDSADGIRLLFAKNLKLTGILSNEVVKNKRIILDSISCDKIDFYQPPQINISADNKTEKKNDSTGFMNVYSIDLKHIGFPEIQFHPAKKSSMVLGKMAIRINDVKTDRIGNVREKPLNYSKEVAIDLSSMKFKSKDNKYDFILTGMAVNSLSRTFRIQSFQVNPYKPELAFAAAHKYQIDRYDLIMKNLVFKDIVMEDVLDKKLIGSRLDVGNTTAKIYRDLTKPLEQKSKVGNYPSQLLGKLDMKISMDKVQLQNAYIEYKEKQENTDSTGIVAFSNANITISNVSNLAQDIKKNPEMPMDFTANILKEIPISGSFIFRLNDDQGRFRVNGKTNGFDAEILNKVTIPMAMIKIRTGKINSLQFNFTGDNHQANGKVILKYEDLKVDVLKRDKNTNDIKKRGLVSLFANIIVKKENPQNGELREATPEYERNEYKSFFNLVWKTLFTGMKETVGMP